VNVPSEEANRENEDYVAIEAALAKALQLTSRQAAIMRCLLSGATNKSIAADLGISPYTVRDHVANLMHKLHAETRHELKAIAARIATNTD
jgi:DNA-binding CsgD family transcriptional regulator